MQRPSCRYAQHRRRMDRAAPWEPRMPAKLAVGVGRTDITPPLGTILMGYPTNERAAGRVRDPLHATALVFQRGDRKAALLSLDLCVVVDSIYESIRRGVAKRTGIPYEAVIAATIQTHSAPRTQLVWGWCDL